VHRHKRVKHLRCTTAATSGQSAANVQTAECATSIRCATHSERSPKAFQLLQPRYGVGDALLLSADVVVATAATTAVHRHALSCHGTISQWLTQLREGGLRHPDPFLSKWKLRILAVSLRSLQLSALNGPGAAGRVQSRSTSGWQLSHNA
jgi:hypothetical protein